ncbi:glycosyltransferase family 2 protein [Telmatospirillum sp. J64-1]|uniref:glycosyltransferase family 2 protein n=1 Tax=Telmatospirillum sp. J64-1 TaxID=2502183 RepID=UPI00115D27CC|nr:glycosyltransferase family 2 protein [Telmatospirillum sp. J64-1]
MSLGVSFIVPVYNKAPWLPAVLNALWAQRGDFEREFIFVDDGSTDESMPVLERQTADWPNVTIVRQANAGAASATNRGIERARLPYIKFCDADDLLAHDATQVLLNALHGSGAYLAFGDAVMYREGESIDLSAPLPEAEVEYIAEPLRPTVRTSRFNPTQMLVNTRAAQEVGGCDERVIHTQDYSLSLRLARIAPFVHVKTTLAYIPAEVPGRVTRKDPGWQLQRVTRTLAYFLRDNPDVPIELKRLACRQAAGRAWKYQKRQRGATILSPWFWRSIKSSLFTPSDPEFIEDCTRAFDPEEKK